MDPRFNFVFQDGKENTSVQSPIQHCDEHQAENTSVQSPIQHCDEHQAENTSVQHPIQHCDEQDSCEESMLIHTWEEPQTGSRNSKMKLVADNDVYLTKTQLSQANHKANGNLRKLVIDLLDTFFTRDRLAESSALGAKSAHNKKDDKASVPWSSMVLSSLKQYVLCLYTRPNGEPCLTDAVFNDIINQKCATSRRSLKTKKKIWLFQLHNNILYIQLQQLHQNKAYS
ncbi:hypothetical protein ACJMK2_019270 [Sinanodonta woodiana]|uniref:BEN domain-containing protein n=1 Tax=Sinanodonta woodiana TaxID=1069815 RepID=A0ABD3UHC4_SINWO